MSGVAKLESALTKLTQDGAETGKILNAAERLLTVAPQHPMALQCKAVCCVHADKFGAALAVLDTLERGSDSSKGGAATNTTRFQRAYCLYRMRRFAEAKAVLTADVDGSLTEHIPSRHLLAQVHYNLEEFAEAAAIYRSLIDDNVARDDDEETELETNYAAVLALGNNPRQAAQVAQSAVERTGDLAYNAATGLVEAGEYADALKALEQAESLFARAHARSCVASLRDALELSEKERAATIGADGTPERHFFNDVANTWVQMAYAHYAMHNEEAAASVLALVLAARPTSAVTTAVASINWTAIRRGTDFVEASKKLKAAQNAKVASRLTTKQRVIVRYNMALLHLNVGNLRSCRKLVDAMAKDHPESELVQSLRLVIAARELKGKKQQATSTVEGFVKEFVAANPNAKAQAGVVPLIAVQVYVENGDVAKALEAMESPAVGEIANKPAGIVTRAAWLVQLGQVKEAVRLVEKAIPTFSSTATQRAVLSWVVHYLAAVNEVGAISSGDSSDNNGDASSQMTPQQHAAGLLQRVRKNVPELTNDKELTAMLGLALVLSGDIAAARQCLSTVAPAVASLSTPSMSDIAALEKNLPSRSAIEELGYHRRVAADVERDGTTAAAAASPNLQQQQQRLRRRRARPMRRPPRNMPEGRGKAPDPERWVPMPLRSYIKDLPNRKKKELKRLRALEQEQKRREAERRKVNPAGEATAAE